MHRHTIIKTARVTMTSCLFLFVLSSSAAGAKYNVLFIISDDLTYTALSCYGNSVCKTPNIDRLAERGVRFTRAFCQGTYCAPSRSSFMSGYYPHATETPGAGNPRSGMGDRATWPQYFKDRGYYTARVSKVFHMGVPGGIEKGTDGADDVASWDERYNSQGPEWRAPHGPRSVGPSPLLDPRGLSAQSTDVVELCTADAASTGYLDLRDRR